MRHPAGALVLGLLLGVPARAAEAAEEGDAAPSDGPLGSVPAWKWSGHTLPRGTWVVGLGVVATGLVDEVDLAVESGATLVGHYNLRARVAVGETDRLRVAVDGGAGVVTPVALAALFVSGWDGPPALTVADLGLPITWTLADGRSLTVRPWLAAATGSISEGDGPFLASLLGRSALNGGGAEAIVEVHLTDHVGIVGWQELALDGSGGQLGVGSRTGGALLLATGPLRANLGLGLFASVSGEAVRVSPFPAVDVWVRF